MSFAYTVGWPGWKIAARLGIPLRVVFKFFRDTEAGVFVASCDNFLPEFAITCESETWDGLLAEIKACLEDASEATIGNMHDSNHHQIKPKLVHC